MESHSSREISPSVVHCVCVCVDGRGIKKKIEFRSLMAMRKKLGESGSSAPNTHSSSETGSADIAVLPLQENKARNLVLLSNLLHNVIDEKLCVVHQSPSIVSTCRMLSCWEMICVECGTEMHIVSPKR